MNSIQDALHTARQRIDATDAELLMAHALGASRSWLFAHGRDVLPPEHRLRFDALVERRAAGEPVAYLVGRRGFWSLDLRVTPATLIPRPETELLVELVLERVPRERQIRVVDLGTGSGAIALAIARERPDAQVVATDASADALAVARDNAARYGVDTIVFREGSWFSPLGDERFDIVASNPPYIADGDAHLQQGDLRCEPRSALASGPDGLDDLRAIIAGASAHLVDDGWLLLEHGFDQGAAVRALFEAAAFTQVETRQDLEGRDRVTLGRRG